MGSARFEGDSFLCAKFPAIGSRKADVTLLGSLSYIRRGCTAWSVTDLLIAMVQVTRNLPLVQINKETTRGSIQHNHGIFQPIAIPNASSL